MKNFVVSLCITLVETVAAAPICPPTKSQIAGSQEVTKFFFKTAVIGPADRRNLKEFAKESGESEAEIAKRYAGSLDIYCGNHFAQAQLILRNDLLLVPAHLLYEKDDCKTPRDVGSCKVFIKEKGSLVTYDVDKAEAIGYQCPYRTHEHEHNDWAILRLKQPMKSSIKPYKIKAAPCASEDKPTDVVFVAKSSDYGRAEVSSMAEAPRHYGRCQVMQGNCSDPPSAMESDCDMDRGASGGGFFVGGKQPVLIGVNSAHYDKCPESKADQTGPYRHDCWSSAGAPITDALVKQLNVLAKK